MASGEVVEAIGAEFGITQAAVSQHLKVLRESGFAKVRAERRGGSIRWMRPGFRRWMHGSAASGISGSQLDALATEIARGKRERRNAPLTKRPGKRA